MTSVNAAITQDGARARGFYRLIWRWHFYAGVLCIPVILTLSISGAIYLFKPQIDAWVEQPYQSLKVGIDRHTPNEQIDVALRALSGAQFSSYRLPETDHEAVVVNVMHAGERKLVYVDPYSLTALKVVGYDDQFIHLVRSFHGELLAGDIGSILVELAGCWTIVLIVTGLYLWWPRTGRGLGGVVYPRLSASGRIFWRDLHAVVGVWLSIALLFLLISGLPWAMVWGGAFNEVRSIANSFQSQDWSVSRSGEKKIWRQSAFDQVDLTPQLLDGAQALRFAPPAELTLSNANANTWQLASDHQNRTVRAVASLDGGSGEVVSVTPFADRPLVDRIIGIGISIHEGHLFGWVNHLLGLIVALGAVCLSVTGFVMWWRRKPTDQLGAPPPIPEMHSGRIAAFILVVLAVLLPLLAISLVVLLVFEWLVVRRIEPISQWLGLATRA